MLLDVGVSATKITDEEYDDPNDVIIPYVDENFDYMENIVDEEMTVDNDHYNETSVRFNTDVSKIAINDILNEMRMDSPIENDLFNDILNDEANNNLYYFGNSNLEGSATNLNNCYNFSFNLNNDFKGQNEDNNLLDQLLYPETCSTPDVQVEFNDGVQFQYDASDQFNCEPDITLRYLEEPNSTSAVQDSNGLNFEINIANNCDTNNRANYEIDNYFNQTETISNNPRFECSTDLPMTTEELQSDIEKYLNNEENYSYASFYEYADMINNTNDKLDDFPYNSEMLQEYINEQNQLLQTLESVNPVESYGPPNISPSAEYKAYQCNVCSYYTQSLQGLSVHMRVHSDVRLSCNQCKFTTTKAYQLKQHEAYVHGTPYCCDTCHYVTHSSTKIRSHMLKEH